MPEVKETETGIVISQDAEEEKFRVELHPDDWERSGTVWACKKDVPGLTGNGIIKAFPDEEAIKENAKSRSYAMKIISDILAEGVLVMKTEDNVLSCTYIDKKCPPETIYLDIEQLSFDKPLIVDKKEA